MFFSIIIPVFNKDASILLRTLVSIFAQKYPVDQYEVIIVLDGEPLEKHKKISFDYLINLGMPLRYYYLDNEGLGSPVYALNFGIKKSKAPFIIINGADIVHISPVFEGFENLFLNQTDSECDSYTAYPEFSNPAINVGFDESVFKNDLLQEENIFIATVWRIRYKDKFEQIFARDSEAKWIKKTIDDNFLKYLTDQVGLDVVRDQLVGDQKRIGYPFLIAAKADLFYEMNGFNENMYRIGWDDFDWWIRSLFFAKTVHVHNIHGLHQWHSKNKELDESKDLNRDAGISFLKRYFEDGFVRPVANLGNEWGLYNKIEANSKEEIINPNMFFEGSR